ncbi:MAG: paraquat-inducible protein A, partial [Pseudomonadota bacterium]
MPYPSLAPGESARCPRCGYAIASRTHQAMDRLIAMSITGLLLLVFASAFPFLGYNTSGQEKQITLLQTVSTLWENDYPELGVLTAIFIIIAPALFLASLLYVLLHLRAGAIPPGGKTICKSIFHLIPWAMAEVFFVGVLVSLIKVAAMAAVEPGLSLWAFVLFCLVFP